MNQRIRYPVRKVCRSSVTNVLAQIGAACPPVRVSGCRWSKRRSDHLKEFAWSGRREQQSTSQSHSFLSQPTILLTHYPDIESAPTTSLIVCCRVGLPHPIPSSTTTPSLSPSPRSLHIQEQSRLRLHCQIHYAYDEIGRWPFNSGCLTWSSSC
jgi:hypothetical protein